MHGKKDKIIELGLLRKRLLTQKLREKLKTNGKVQNPKCKIRVLTDWWESSTEANVFPPAYSAKYSSSVLPGW